MSSGSVFIVTDNPSARWKRRMMPESPAATKPTTYAPVVVCLPTADRPTSYAFYRDGLGLEPIGELADDGVPEPLQFAVNDGMRLMLIPTGGFGWI
nr:VOC family protein [Micromonospora sp. DSM 115978]